MTFVIVRIYTGGFGARARHFPRMTTRVHRPGCRTLQAAPRFPYETVEEWPTSGSVRPCKVCRPEDVRRVSG